MDTLFLDEIAATPTWHGSRAAIYKKPDGNLYFKDGPSGTETGLSGTAAISSAWPVGSIYIAAVSTDPATLMGFGTWARFGTGKVLVSQLDGDADFGTNGATGGEKTHTLTTAELAVHSHGVTDPTHTHTQAGNTMIESGTNQLQAGSNVTLRTDASATAASSTGISIQNAGSGSAHNNLQPYIVVYMWQRTA